MKLTIDGNEYSAEAGQTVLQVCQANGINVPYFCYHPRLSVAGNCRMCLVEVEGRPKPEISCNLAVQDGMVVRTNSPSIIDDRRAVLEFILINHPLDCPICDQAGECDLQDQYFDYSAQPYRFREEKTAKPKAVPLGDLVVLDDERCITCTRCVRFCDEVAGEHELCVTNRGDHSTIGTFNGEGMKNAYSLNTVDICPVGALTNRDFRFNKRSWFLSQTDSICTGCATGCNVMLDHEGGLAYRYRPRENDAVNESWMCDEGRLTYKYINSPDRIASPHARIDESWVRVGWDAALNSLGGVLERIPAAERGVVLSAQCSNEENAAWHALATEVWKTPHVFVTKREYANGSSDDILRHADKNPNSAGVAALGVSAALASGPRLLIVLDTLSAEEQQRIANSSVEYVVVLSTNWGTHPDAARWHPLSEVQDIVERGGGADLLEDLRSEKSKDAIGWAQLVFPLASVAEQDGSFTNAKNITQTFHQAFPAKGEARTAWQVAQDVAALEGEVLETTLHVV